MSSARSGYGTSDGYPPLPPGRNLLPPDYVDSYQRRRMVVAVAELAHEEGLAGVTVTGLAARARISRKTFYDYFANRDECLDYAGEEAASYLFAELAEVNAGRPEEGRIDSGVEALLAAVAAEPKMAELALVHAPALSGKRGRHFQEIALEAIAGLVAAGERPAGGSTRGAETIASAIMGVIACQVRRGEAERAADLGAEVVRLASLPAVGVESEGLAGRG